MVSSFFNTVKHFSQNKINEVKRYFSSDLFEDDLDFLIINLQMFDVDLEVPDFSKLNKRKRINRKIKLVQSSFNRLNITYGTIGFVLGAKFGGPKVAGIGALLGSGIFATCLIATLMNKHELEIVPV